MLPTACRYDKMSAYELFRRFGVSERAYELFLKPTLAVGLFAPPEQLSAAAVLETLYFYALSHQNNFDVCWCKGSISEKIFMPLVKNIEDSGGKVLGGRLVTGLVSNPESDTIAQVKATLKDGREETYPCDALILAVSISGMQKLISNVPELGNRREFGAIMNLKSIDCIATRLWFDEKISTRFPANVLAGFENDVGCTYFNLSELQDDLKSDPGTVVAADFYGASELLPLSDEEIVRKVHQNITRCEPAFSCCTVLDSAVLRFPRAVTHFSPGSYTHRPRQVTSLLNTFLAGDYIKGLDHGANGLSQERAYVAGLAAANYVVNLLGVGQPAQILPVNPDEPHVGLAKRFNSVLTEALRLSFP